MTEIGRQCQDLVINIDALLVLAHESMDHKAVAEIVDARTACPAFGSPTQALSPLCQDNGIHLR